jgi:hypothetical protein
MGWIKGQSGNKNGRPRGSVTVNHKPYKKDQKPIDYLYLIKQEGYFKIGISKTPARRLAVLQASTPFDVEIVLLIPIKINAVVVEKQLHDYFSGKHIRGEWYALTDVDCEFIKMHCIEFQVLTNPEMQCSIFELDKQTESYG